MTLNNWVKVNLWQVISLEPFDLQPSYLAQAEKDVSKNVQTNFEWLEQLGQGQSQVISWEPFDLQPSYLAQGDMLASPTGPLILNDLEHLGQGQSLAGDIWGTIWPTTFIFGAGGQVSKLYTLIKFEWPWTIGSRSIFGRQYLGNGLTYNLHIWHRGYVSKLLG